MLLIRFLSTRWSQTNPPPAPHNRHLKKKKDSFLCSCNLVNRAAKSQYVRGTVPYTVIRNAHAKATEQCYLQMSKATEINNNVCVPEKKKQPDTPSSLLDQPQAEITVISHNPFHPWCWHQVVLRFCVAALCSSQSTGPLINRLELLTGGSSIPHRPCHFHYCISITPHFRDKARKRRRAGQKTSSSLAF